MLYLRSKPNNNEAYTDFTFIPDFICDFWTK